jgi:hypothetical protein
MTMKRLIDRFRKWMIVKLGGYIKPPAQVVRIDRAVVPIQKVYAEQTYLTGCSHEDITKNVAYALGKELCKAGLVKFQYSEHPYDAHIGRRIVRATVRVVEPEEEW